jgi:hypothetical protein
VGTARIATVTIESDDPGFEFEDMAPTQIEETSGEVSWTVRRARTLPVNRASIS